VAVGAAERQLADLTALGLSWDGPVVRQSERVELFSAAISQLEDLGLVYECFCTRREIHAAASAPHGPQGAYPGTCRDLTDAQLLERRRSGRPPALRLRAEVAEWTIRDELVGSYTGLVDDLVLRRSDGVAAYNLAVVVDDAAQGVDQVVRGDDLLASTPRQACIGHLLALPEVTYAHVPMAVNVHGARLAKRDGAVTLSDLRALGRSPADALSAIAQSLRLARAGETVTPEALLSRFDPLKLPREPWVVDPARW
jgi:glutamyl-tRNA synthetase